MRLIGTILLLCISLNGYADCMNETPEEMSFYAYMTEDELHRGYCTCMGMYQIKMDSSDSFKQIGQLDSALMYNRQAGMMLDERTKITRVLQKDYETAPKECPK